MSDVAPTTPARQPGGLMLALAVGAFISLVTTLALTPFLPHVAEELSTSVALVGQVPALIGLTAVPLALVGGPLADHFGHRRLLVIGLLAALATALGTALAPTYGLLLAVALLGGLNRALVTPVSQAIASLHFADDRRRRAISWITAGASGAIVAGIPVLTAIAGRFGWRAAFVALALALGSHPVGGCRAG